MAFKFAVCVLLLCLLSLVRGEECYCSSYIIGEGGLSEENKLIELGYELDDVRCDGDGLATCKEFCNDMLSELTSNGNLCALIPDEDITGGQWTCDALKRDVCGKRAGSFARSCGSDLVDTGMRYLQEICCEDGKFTNC